MAKYDFSQGASGALSGAASGAAIGSVVPGIGTGIGAAGGALIGGISSLFGSKKKKTKPKRLNTFDPQQQQLYQQYISSLTGKGPLADMYNYNPEQANQNFDANVSRPAYRNFEENIVPTVTGQFRQGGLMNSSYAGDALARRGRDVQENLDAQRSNMHYLGQQNTQASRQNAINSILGTQSFAYSKPGAKQPGAIDQILGSVAPAAGEWFANYLRDKNSANSLPQGDGSVLSQSTSVYPGR